MKFDIIIGNPPYQESTGSGLNESGAVALFDSFIEAGIDITASKLCMITPSKWMSGNQSNYVRLRKRLLLDGHLEKMIDYFNPKDIFPRLEIAGGVSYFLYNKDYIGKCEFTTIMNTESEINYISKRKFNCDTIIPRHAVAEDIINKIGKIDDNSKLSTYIYKNLWKLPTNFVGSSEKRISDTDIKIVTPKQDYYEPMEDKPFLDTYKVMFTRVVNGSTFLINSKKKILSSLNILKPGEICNASYMVLPGIKTLEYAENFKTYLETKFVRFLVLQTLFGIGLTPDRFQFVPIQDFTKQWTDKELYTKYSLTEDEIKFIENIIADYKDNKINRKSNYTPQDIQANFINKQLQSQDTP